MSEPTDASPDDSIKFCSIFFGWCMNSTKRCVAQNEIKQIYTYVAKELWRKALRKLLTHRIMQSTDFTVCDPILFLFFVKAVKVTNWPLSCCCLLKFKRSILDSCTVRIKIVKSRLTFIAGENHQWHNREFFDVLTKFMTRYHVHLL